MKRKRHSERLTVHRINKRTSSLPDSTTEHWLLLLRCVRGGVVVLEQKLFYNHRAGLTTCVPGFTHYVIIPNSLYP